MTRSISDFLNAEQIASIRKPIQDALTLPALAFVDEDFYQLEVNNIYQNNWIATLFESDVPNIGDIKPVYICEIPLLAVRGQDKKIRVFHNICPYDGCLAAIDSSEGSDSIVTPYHGWVYDLEGRLIKTPYWDGSRDGNLKTLEGKQVNLVSVHSESFLNTVFINLADFPEPFSEYIAPLFKAMSEYDLENSEPGLGEDRKVYTSTTTAATNWKTLFENACLNVLHENFVHAIYNISPEVPRIKEDGVASFYNVIDAKFMALGYNRLDFQNTYPPIEAPHLGKNSRLEPEEETFGTLYPNFYVSASSQFLEVSYVLPMGPDKSESNASYHFQKDVALADDAIDERMAVAKGFFGAFEEDRRIIEAVQKARKSPVYQQKFYAPFWDEMHYYFTNLVLDDLER